jgi:hypothetical protein
MKAPQFKHYFNIRNGKFIWEAKDMFEYKRKALEGKRGYAIIEEEVDKVTPNQYAYYFGGIIRMECMNSEAFQGLTDKQIHSVLFAELRSSTKGILLPNGTTKLVQVTEDFSDYKKDDMRKYIEELIPYLNVEYQIYPKPSEHYKDNKFYINPKVYK